MRLRQKFSEYKERAIALRRGGNTYPEIRKILEVEIPQSTLSEWLSCIVLSPEEQQRLNVKIDEKLKIAQNRSIEVRRIAKENRFQKIREKYFYVADLLQNESIGKIILATMYWCEGSKSGALRFANSDPRLIQSFLFLLRKCFSIDEKKFRGVVQCRADQNTDDLENFWIDTTKIPKSQFYKARMDPRSINKPTKKLDYKGVCAVDYFSAELYNELKIISELIVRGL